MWYWALIAFEADLPRRPGADYCPVLLRVESRCYQTAAKTYCCKDGCEQTANRSQVIVPG
jgi:hypothetical protein